MHMKKWIVENSWTLGYIAFMLLYGAFAVVSFLCKEPALVGLGVVFFAMTAIDLCLKIKKLKNQEKENDNK